MRLVLGDDHRMFLDALHAGLEARGHVVAALCSDLGGLPDTVVQHQPDVCVLDLDFYGRSVIATAEAIRFQAPAVRLLVLTGAATGEVWKAFDERVVDGVVNKLCGLSVLDRAIEEVGSGRRVVEQFTRPPVRRAATGMASLSARERSVLTLLIAGASTDEMARTLGVSTQTVRTHVQSVLRKLGVNSRLRAARLAAEAGVESLETYPLAQ